MHFISFNINSVRARIHQVQAIVEKYQPAVIGLQETKVQDSEFPHGDLADLGYEIITHGQKGHYGVALMTNLPILETYKGLPGDTEESQNVLLAPNWMSVMATMWWFTTAIFHKVKALLTQPSTQLSVLFIKVCKIY